MGRLQLGIFAVLLVVVLAVASVVGGTNPAAGAKTATISAVPELLFHKRSGRNDVDIYTIGADGTGLRPIATEPADDHFAAWSPDGGSFAFVRSDWIYFGEGIGGGWAVREQRIRIRDMATGETRTIVENASDAKDSGAWLPTGLLRWSPNGASLAFQDDDWSVQNIRWECPRLMVVDITGGSPRHVVRTAGLGGWDWSPGGKRIVYEPAPRDSLLCDQEATRIAVIDVASGRSSRLTAGTHPDWSPDGRRIAFVRGGSLFVISPSGRARRRIATGSGYLGSLSWAPDSRRIAFTRCRSWRCGLFIARIDGTQPRMIGPRFAESFEHTTPSWSPDGRLLAWTGRSGLFIGRADGRVRPLHVASGFAPDWRPSQRASETRR